MDRLSRHPEGGLIRSDQVNSTQSEQTHSTGNDTPIRTPQFINHYPQDLFPPPALVLLVLVLQPVPDRPQDRLKSLGR
jgi:hypothetical protein